MTHEDGQQESIRLSAGARSYFLDLKTSEHGPYVTITESRAANGSFERQRVLIEGNLVKEFSEALQRLVAGAALNSYQKWTEAEDETLKSEVDAGTGVAEIARSLGREPNAIRSRMRHLGLRRSE